MIEALMVISIIIVLSISLISLINSLFTMFKQNMVANELMEVQKNIAARYSVYGHYDNIPTTIAKWKEEKILPNQMILENSLRHRLGGAVTITPRLAYTGAPHNDYFDVVFDKISATTCLNLGQISWGVSQGATLIELKINSDKFVLPSRYNINSGITSKGADNALPVKTNVLMKKCKDNNTMTWTFR